MKQDTSLHSHTLREMESLLTKLKSRYVGERKEAEQRLQAMGASAVEPLLSLITRENQLRIKRRRMYMGVVAFFCLTFLPAGLFCLYMAITLGMAGSPLAGGYGGAVGGLLGGGAGGLLGGFSWLLQPTPLQWNAAEALSKIEDKRAVGGLALAVGMPSTFAPDLRYGVASALQNLLPRIDADDANLLDNAQRENLYQALSRSHRDKEAEFLIAIVDALARIGDVKAIPAVEKLVGMPATTANEHGVQQSAMAALDILRTVQERQRSNETLLRPSQAGSPETLLRATLAPGESNPQVLLRATSTEYSQEVKNS